MTGFVYFFSDGSSIKIGYSRDVAARLAKLRTSSSRPLIQIGSLPGTQRHERAVHERLQAFRLEGEWFRDCPEVRSVITRLLAAGWEQTEPRAPLRPPPPVFQPAKDAADIILKYADMLGICGSSKLGMLESLYAIPSGLLWSLQYRPAKDVSMSAYVALLRAADKITAEAQEALTADSASIKRAQNRIGAKRAQGQPSLSQIIRARNALRAVREAARPA